MQQKGNRSLQSIVDAQSACYVANDLEETPIHACCVCRHQSVRRDEATYTEHADAQRVRTRTLDISTTVLGCQHDDMSLRKAFAGWLQQWAPQAFANVFASAYYCGNTT
jgi:hypothetical protein